MCQSLWQPAFLIIKIHLKPQELVSLQETSSKPGQWLVSDSLLALLLWNILAFRSQSTRSQTHSQTSPSHGTLGTATVGTSESESSYYHSTI